MLEKDKVVTLYEQIPQLIEIEKPVIVPLEIPTPVDRVVEKLVVQENIQERLVPHPQVIEKIVGVKE